MALCPLWQELTGSSGHKLRFWKLGAASTVTGAPAIQNLWCRFGRTWGHIHTTDTDVLRTPGVVFRKYGDASMQTEDPSLVRACGEA